MKSLLARVRTATAAMLMMAALLPLLAGCLPGSSDAVAPPNAASPSEEVFVNLFRAIEERRPDRFNAAVDVSSTPARERLFEDLTAFLNTADNIEYVVTVDNRGTNVNDVLYVFSWQRKHKDKESGEIKTVSGNTEWMFSRASGRFLLVQQSGTALF